MSFSAVLDAQPDGTIAIISQVGESGDWIDGITFFGGGGNAAGTYDMDYTGMGLTNPPSILVYSYGANFIANCGNGLAAWEPNGVTNTHADLITSSIAGGLGGVERFSVKLIPQD